MSAFGGKADITIAPEIAKAPPKRGFQVTEPAWALAPTRRHSLRLALRRVVINTIFLRSGAGRRGLAGSISRRARRSRIWVRRVTAHFLARRVVGCTRAIVGTLGLLARRLVGDTLSKGSWRNQRKRYCSKHRSHSHFRGLRSVNL